MSHALATVALGPLLWLQVRHVRRATPRLPEAAGEREGETGEGPPLRLLILGDSAAAGVGAATQSEALSGQLAGRLAARFRVRWRLEAASGRTTLDALRQLDGIPAQAFDVCVTSLGVNDLTARVPPARWIGGQSRLVALLREKFRARRILLSGLPPVHLFPALPQPLRWYLGAQARRYDQRLAHWAEQSPDCEFVPLAFEQRRELMASDGFHPGPPAYAAWAEALARQIVSGN